MESEELIVIPNDRQSTQATSGKHMKGCTTRQRNATPTITDPLPNRSCWRKLQTAERSPQRVQTL